MTDAPTQFAFELHHIFPTGVLNDPDIATDFANLFPEGQQPGDRFLNWEGNKISLYSNADHAAAVQSAIAGGDTLHLEAGRGGAQHSGSHLGYSNFLRDELTQIFTNGGDAEHQRTAIYDLHRFATEVSQGVITHNGETLTVAGGANYAVALSDAWGARRINDPSAPDALTQNGLGDYIADLDTTATDTGTGRDNTRARFNSVSRFIDKAHAEGGLTDAKYDEYRERLDSVRKDSTADNVTVESSTFYNLRWSDRVTIFIAYLEVFDTLNSYSKTVENMFLIWIYFTIGNGVEKVRDGLKFRNKSWVYQ